MDKSAIKTFAIESRRQTIESVKYQAGLIGITSDGIAEPISKAEGMETYDYGAGTYSIFDEEIKKRESLVREIENKGFDNVVEEVAYTWFNRIIAIRFMEVNDYLPTRTRVLSSEDEGKTEPDIVTEALDIDLDYAQDDKNLVLKLRDENKLDELFRFLFIKQCKKLNEILPGLFEKTDDYLELLLNISFTNEEGIVRQLIDKIPEKDFENQVEIIGWLYQFYNSELKDDTYKNLKKSIKIPKERIPAATQLFTPDWIVKYMVENSVGRLWLNCHPNDELKSKWKYYVEEAKQESDVDLKIVEIKNDEKNLKLEDIKVIDPCMGSGHILVYVFDVLMDIYISEGFTEKDAAKSIIINNIYGLDIDKRAYQLSYFAILMKARKYNRTIFNKHINPLVCSIEETNSLSNEFINQLISFNNSIESDLKYLVDLFNDAKVYGSLIEIAGIDLNKIEETMNKFDVEDNLNKFKFSSEIFLLKNIIKQSKILSKKYTVVITNPPYMGNSSMNVRLNDYLKKNFPNSKSDLFAVFIERCNKLTEIYLAMITQQSFMFLSTYEKLRLELIYNSTIINMVHLGAHAFEEIGGEVVQATSFILRHQLIKNYLSTFHRLTDFNSSVDKETEFFNTNNVFVKKQFIFDNIPGNPIAYWINNDLINCFKNNKIMDIGSVKSGLSTGDNNRFLRYWYEVNFEKIGFSIKSADETKNSLFKWFPHNKGGEFRKWYGNQEYVVNWENNGEEIRNIKDSRGKLKSRPQNIPYYFKKALTWSRISSSNFGVRFSPPGFVFDVNGPSLFIPDEYYYYIGALLCSDLSTLFLSILNPTITFQVGNINTIPVILNDEKNEEITKLAKSNVDLCKNDWDDYESSWNFTTHPLLKFKKSKIQNSFESWEKFKLKQYNLLYENEIKLNKIFSDIYNVNLSIDYDSKNISIIKANYEMDMKSFISYAIGCMFGRYSLDKEGLIYAGGNFSLNDYSTFKPDDDNIIPVLDTEYFNDDIVGRFVKFVKICFGEETLEENLDFFAGALNKKGKTSREIIRNYFLQDFFKNHVQLYHKCPIYWQFDSGKQNAFKCLIYMHRYDPDVVARVRTDYLHKTQKAIEQNLAHCENIIVNSSNKSEISKATKDKNKYIKQLDEIKVYDEALGHIANQHIEIDLDDGVKVNYAKFQNVEIFKEGEKTKKINLLKKI